ncbi:DNA (cytosine-5)-methyltransferase 3B [Frankliniella fusca]|uniref:DNA (cytosine-5-)-methyltransferase n=1 Tax=Frankliniella fusca TaxID=407009 RepID=A0AAE1LG63_9NEOP|nr:DNA (cytosine-5)-methyltransferase 3B [Frankliniella fusca]
MVYRRRGSRKCWKPPPKGQRLKVKPFVKRRKHKIVEVQEGQREGEEVHFDATSEGIYDECSECHDKEGSSAKDCNHESHSASQASQECSFVLKVSKSSNPLIYLNILLYFVTLNFLQACETGKSKIRVLSLFDGISTGYYILTKCLGLDVDAYFSSEIDLSAKRVQLHNFGDEVTPVGDIGKISDEQLASLGHIDLIIGGSPCEELSRVNWRRKGLDDPSGTGVLFYQYVRVLNFFKEKTIKEGTKLYWLFENTATMDAQTKSKITMTLGCDPIVRCSSSFVPMNRKRYFWHNLPEVYCFMATHKNFLTLQDYLEPYRKALVQKVPTLTTNVAAQCSGKKNIRPVEWNGEEEYLSPTDYERLLGFPKHFTDCGLTHSARIKVLGKSWSVHVVASLLYPLSDMYQSAPTRPGVAFLEKVMPVTKEQGQDSVAQTTDSGDRLPLSVLVAPTARANAARRCLILEKVMPVTKEQGQDSVAQTTDSGDRLPLSVLVAPTAVPYAGRGSAP